MQRIESFTSSALHTRRSLSLTPPTSPHRAVGLYASPSDRPVWKGEQAEARAQQGERESPSAAGLRVKRTCYGCGAKVQVIDSGAPGYVEPERYAQKQQFRQLDQLLCRRCRQLSHGTLLPAVEESWMEKRPEGHGDRLLVTPEQLRLQLAGIRDQRALVVLLVDLLDASGTFLPRLRDLVGRNPVVLVGTKADLLPDVVSLADTQIWLSDMAAANKLSAIHTCAVSSRKGTGIQAAAAFIRQQRLGRDVYIVGAANVGKSAFIRALMQDMSDFSSRQFDAAAANTAKRLPVVSALPGTTLGLITLKAFATGGRLIDTPGLHLQHRIQHRLAPGDFAKLQPASRLRQFTAPSLANVGRADVEPTSREEATTAASYAWGALARIDVRSACRSCTCTFFVPKGTHIGAAPLGTSDRTESGPGHRSSKQTSESTDIELHVAKQAVLQGSRRFSVLADVAVSGLPGWASISAGELASVHLRIWAPAGVKIFIRPPMPCSCPAYATG